MNKYSVLKKYFGYDDFKYPQDKIIDEVQKGNELIAILPTGFGKSIIFQVLALLQEGVSLIISPLIALMEDQVNKLIRKGIPAVLLNSSLDYREQQVIYQKLKSYKIIYVSPERLENQKFLFYIAHLPISFIAIDEAHTILWADGFRLAFGHIHSFIESLPTRPKLLALTATATENTIDKIKNYLRLKNPMIIDMPMDRKNLYYQVEILTNKLEYLKKYLLRHSFEKGIIYCLTRKEVEELHIHLEQWGMQSTIYHGGLDSQVKEQNQKNFTEGICSLMICTNAFGMGIDIPDIRFVMNYSLPQSLEDLVQQMGRASRDGKYGEGIVLFSFADIQTVKYFIEQQEDKKIKKEAQKKLDCLIDYCLSKKCRHQFISRYFQNQQQTCKNFCDNCQKK